MWMFGQRRAQAVWLLVVMFTTMTLGVCTALISHAGGKLPCCADAPDQASLTACCPTGQQSSTSELPLSVQVAPQPESEIAFEVTPQSSPDHLSRRRSFSAIPYASADLQALLSTFLI